MPNFKQVSLEEAFEALNGWKGFKKVSRDLIGRVAKDFNDLIELGEKLSYNDPFEFPDRANFAIVATLYGPNEPYKIVASNFKEDMDIKFYPNIGDEHGPFGIIEKLDPTF